MSCYGLARVPSVHIISQILRKELMLSKTQYDSQVINYNHPRYDAKRFVITQVVTSLLADDCLVVCIDESSFSTHQWKKHRWRPKASSNRHKQSSRENEEVH